MKKSLKTLLVMAVVLVVLGGAAVALWLTAPEPEVEEESSSSTPSYPVIDREAADVESISIESDAGDFTIVPLEEETSSASSESSVWFSEPRRPQVTSRTLQPCSRTTSMVSASSVSGTISPPAPSTRRWA